MSKKQEKLDAPKKLKILFTIINRNKIEFYLDALETYNINLQLVMYSTDFVFDNVEHKINDHDTALIISVVEEERVQEILNAYEDKYFKTRAGSGYGFTVSIDSMIGVMAYKLLANLGVE